MSAITSCFAPWYKGIYLLLFAILTYYLHNNWRTWVKLSFIYFAFWKKFLCDTPVRANAHRNLYLLAFVGSKWPIALWDFMIQQYHIQELTSYLLHFFQAQPTFLRRVFCFCLQHSRSLVIFDKFVLLNSSALHIYHKTSFWFKFAFDDTHTRVFFGHKVNHFCQENWLQKGCHFILLSSGLVFMLIPCYYLLHF